jgi:hypothetical protein
MPMSPFLDRFPELGARETRSLKVTGAPDLPDGEYGFLEMYCDEPGCDCRRVTIAVLRPETEWSKIFATIAYGWESADFYRAWGPHCDPAEMQGPALNPLGPQSKYSPALLDLFRSLIQSPEYVERLKRHYIMFRETVDREHGHKDRGQARGVPTKPKHGRGSNRGRPRSR